MIEISSSIMKHHRCKVQMYHHLVNAPFNLPGINLSDHHASPCQQSNCTKKFDISR